MMRMGLVWLDAEKAVQRKSNVNSDAKFVAKLPWPERAVLVLKLEVPVYDSFYLVLYKRLSIRASLS